MSNPWMSVWLSAANAWAGAARASWIAAMHRQQAAMMNQWVRELMRFWSGKSAAPPAGKRKRNRR